MRNPFHPPLPKALELAEKDLAQAERDLLSYAHDREHYTAMEMMARQRIARLNVEIDRLSGKTLGPSNITAIEAKPRKSES